MATSIRPVSIARDVAELMKANRRVGGAIAASQVPVPAKDRLVISTNGQPATWQLSALPELADLGSSLNLSLNGQELDEATDYSVDYTTGLVTFSSAQQALFRVTPSPADVLTADYLTSDDLIAQAQPGDTGVLLADTFDRADSTSTINPASDGGSWTVDTATWGISSNKGYVSNAVGGNGNWIRRDAGTTAVDVSIDVFVPAANTRLVWVDIMGSGTRTPSSTWTGYEVVFDGTNATGIILSRVQPGVVTQLGISHPADFRNTTVTLRFTHDGVGNFVVYLNGVQQFTAVDAAGLTGTLVHLGTSETGGVAGSMRFDNFTARPM